MDFMGKQVLVIGAGISGIAASKLLSGEGANVILYDANKNLAVNGFGEKLSPDFDGSIIIGRFPDKYIKELDLAIISPGVPTDLELVNELRNNNITIWGETELAYSFSKGKLIAVTGTNGKTTTTALTGEIAKSYFDSVFVVGNIGIPYTDMVKMTTEKSVTVAEMSSFQLETIENFRPDISMILNITPDHLNRHHTMEKYIEAKENIFKNQTENDTCILNYDDEILRRTGTRTKAKIIWFSSTSKLEKGLYLDNDCIVYNDGKNEAIICNVRELNIIGKHNYENAMAAAAAGIALSIPFEYIHKAMISFTAVEHRIEYVATKKGVQYYNDSKGTNPDAAIQAIRAMQTKTILIGGGYDKGSEFDEWIKAFEGKVKYLVLMGQTREKIAKTAEKYGFTDIVMVESMEEAVDFSSKNAEEGETVLLSPCCASWGMFKNYEERGRIFKELVNKL